MDDSWFARAAMSCIALHYPKLHSDILSPADGYGCTHGMGDADAAAAGRRNRNRTMQTPRKRRCVHLSRNKDLSKSHVFYLGNLALPLPFLVFLAFVSVFLKRKT